MAHRKYGSNSPCHHCNGVINRYPGCSFQLIQKKAYRYKCIVCQSVIYDYDGCWYNKTNDPVTSKKMIIWRFQAKRKK